MKHVKFLTFYLPLLMLILGCINTDCDTNYYRQSCSPDGLAQACCSITDCGVTTGGPFTISVFEGCDSVPNIKEKTYLFTHENPVNFSWPARDSLNIEYSGNPLDINYVDFITFNKSKQTIYITYNKRYD